MSNKPRIYGNCPAGCKWETVHKDDFLESASIVRQYFNKEDGFAFEVGRKYRIIKSGNLSTIYNRIKVFGTDAGTGEAKTLFTIDTPHDEFSQYFTFRPLYLEWRDADYAYPQPVVRAVFEFNGERINEVYDCSDKIGIGGGMLQYQLDLSSFTSDEPVVFVYNEDANITLNLGEEIEQMVENHNKHFEEVKTKMASIPIIETEEYDATTFSFIFNSEDNKMLHKEYHYGIIENLSITVPEDNNLATGSTLYVTWKSSNNPTSVSIYGAKYNTFTIGANVLCELLITKVKDDAIAVVRTTRLSQ